jgi:hypothetical protein
MNFCTLFLYFFLLTLMTIDTGYLHLMPFGISEFHTKRFGESYTFSLKKETVLFFIYIFSTSVVGFLMKIGDI